MYHSYSINGILLCSLIGSDRVTSSSTLKKINKIHFTLVPHLMGLNELTATILVVDQLR